ncbi:hypothetical protein ACFVMC_00355 [Nocardia sp. NPDC127579]|uniref:hypothetical protein n=1 Tax=Nocardia sp. NPDC127579 TaxID=3345402 RepID=UPI00362BBA89
MSDNPVGPVIVGAGGDGGGTPSSIGATTPTDPPVTPTEPAAPVNQADPPKPKKDWTPESAAAEIAELRRENASWRTKYREAEPIVEAHNAAQEAAKTEVQRATERADAAEKAAAERQDELNVLRAAAKHGIPEEDYDLLGSGTPEELDARAARLAARYPSSAAPPPPPSDRPVEGLRPGASPTPPAQPDNSYPESWRPAPPRGRT